MFNAHVYYPKKKSYEFPTPCHSIYNYKTIFLIDVTCKCVNDDGPEVMNSKKPLHVSKINSAFHPSEVDLMSTRNFWEFSGKKSNASL